MSRQSTLVLAIIVDIACWSALILLLVLFLPSCAKVPQGTVIAVYDEVVVVDTMSASYPMVIAVSEEMTATEYILE
jgi:hypothetical protein